MGLLDLPRDLRHAVRQLSKAPGYAIAVIVTLAFAIAANSAIFGAVRAVLFDPLPVRAPADLVIAWETDTAGRGISELSYQNFQDWAALNRSFSHTAAVGSSLWTSVLDGHGDPVRLSYAGVSASFFDTLGVQPFLGRTFTAADDLPNAPLVLVLSHSIWTSRFGANPAIVGSTLRLSERPYTVIGVMPKGLDYPRGAEFWTPVVPILAASTKDWRADALRAVGVLFVVGRLRDGVTPIAARAELDALSKQLQERGAAPRFGAVVVATPLLDHVLGPVRPALWALFAATGVLLLIACANVSGLMLTRVSLRQREQAIRVALGATRGRLRRLWILETLVLALAGGALGLIAARWIAAAIVAFAPEGIPNLADVAIDVPVALFTAAVVLVTALLCGLVPMRHASTTRVAEILNAAARGMLGRHSQRARSVLLVFQMAFAVVLLVAAGLTVRSFIALRQLDLGFRPADVLTLTVNLRHPSASNRTFDELLARVAKMPGVTDAGAVFLRPLFHGPIGQGTWVVLEGQGDTPDSAKENPILNYQVATPGYFRALRIPLVRGRLFDARDDERAARVAIVAESTATRLWPGQDPIGRRLRLPTFDRTGPASEWRTVVGVVSDVRHLDIEKPQLDVYDPALQSPISAADVVVRTSGDPLALVGPIQDEARRVGPRALVDRVVTMEAIVARATAPWSFSVWLFTLFATLAFLLATVGLFSVVSLDVAQRSREFAVRLALGAQRRDIFQRVLASAAARVGVGVTAGLLVAVAGTRSMRSLLFAIDPLDAATYAVVVALVCAVVAIASSLPAHRAAGIDPLVLLRRE